MSVQTHLSNFSGDKKAWPVYITLGNLPSTRRNSPGSMAVLLLALLPVPPKLSKSTSADKHQRRINAETLQLTFQLFFEPLQAVAREGVNIDCADGKVRRCFPVLSAWIADHMENVALHGVKSNSCPKCKVLPWELGNDAKYSARDYTEYEYCERQNGLQSPRSDSDNADNADNADVTFDTLRINMGPGVFHGLYRVSAPDLHVPDLLHTNISRIIQAHDGLDPRLSQETRSTSGF